MLLLFLYLLITCQLLLFGMNDEAILLKLHCIVNRSKDVVYCVDTNGQYYLIRQSVDEIKQRIPEHSMNDVEYFVYKKETPLDEIYKKIIFVVDCRDSSLDSLKNETKDYHKNAEIILFYPANISLFISFATQLDKNLGQLLTGNIDQLRYLYPQKNYLVKELF